MTFAIPVQVLPPTVKPDGVRQLSLSLASREQFLRQLIAGFERKYPPSLEELNRRLEARQIAEHPAWEDSIEWGNAIDQVNRLFRQFLPSAP